MSSPKACAVCEGTGKCRGCGGEGEERPVISTHALSPTLMGYGLEGGFVWLTGVDGGCHLDWRLSPGTALSIYALSQTRTDEQQRACERALEAAASFVRLAPINAANATPDVLTAWETLTERIEAAGLHRPEPEAVGA